MKNSGVSKGKLGANWDCVIIGGGPAGLMAALYLQRFRRQALVIDAGASRVRYAPGIRNLVGYTRPLPGKILLQRLRRQAKQYGVQVLRGEASARRAGRTFEVRVGHDVYHTRFLIAAIGIKDVQPMPLDIADLCRKRVLAYCPICDGYDHIDKKIGVFIDSSAGFRKVRFMMNFTRDLHAIAIRDFPISARRRQGLRTRGVRLHQGSLQGLMYQPRSKTLRVKLKSTRPFDLDLGYIELGLKVPRSALHHVHGLRRSRDGRFIVTKHQQTSVPGLYAIGDCANSLAQVSVAVGEAAIAATDIHRKLPSAILPSNHRSPPQR